MLMQNRNLNKKITNKLKPTIVVIILAGIYTAHSKWVDKDNNSFLTTQKHT